MLGHADTAVVDVGRQIDEVVTVRGLVHVLLQKLVGGKMRRLLADPEVRVHDVRDVRHADGGVEVRLPNEKLGPGHQIAQLQSRDLPAERVLQVLAERLADREAAVGAAEQNLADAVDRGEHVDCSNWCGHGVMCSEEIL